MAMGISKYPLVISNCWEISLPCRSKQAETRELETDWISATATVLVPKLGQKSVSAHFWFRLTKFRPRYGYGVTTTEFRPPAECAQRRPLDGHTVLWKSYFFLRTTFVNLFGFNY